jgi:hypothetical protein
MTQREADWAEDIAYEIVQEYTRPPVGAYYTDVALQRMIERALRRVREEAIEECAKAVFKTPCCSDQACPRCPACEATQNVRALKEKSC